MQCKKTLLFMMAALSTGAFGVNYSVAETTESPDNEITSTDTSGTLDNEITPSDALELLGKKKTPANTELKGDASGRTVYYAGYSKKFLETKALIAKGNAEDAYRLREEKLKIENQKKGKNEMPGVLFSLEQAVIALDVNKRAAAITYLENSEAIIKEPKRKSGIVNLFSKMKNEIVNSAGFDEFGEYYGEAYERILMLNYKSIAFMLDGDRKAYNVTRRSIDWQNDEKKLFDQEMAEVKDKLKEVEDKQAEKGNILSSMGIVGVISEQYKNSESKAMQVPSAFVNPFGFYMAGIVQEYDSYEDRSLRDNARISYQKAQELNPDSPAIKQALNDIQKIAPPGERLIHVVIADGFAPEKKVLRFDYCISGKKITMKLPIYEPVESMVSRVEMHNNQGELLANLSQVADIDAIAMRHQYDALPKQHLKITVAVVRTVFENKMLDKMGFLGDIGKKFRDDTTDPDMRSWMGMPKQILAARLFLPKGDGEVRLVSYDKNGKVLAERNLDLGGEEHSFVYVRTVDTAMYVDQSSKLWVRAK